MYLLQVNTSGGVTTNGGSPVVMSPITPELASKLKGELGQVGGQQIIHVPAGAMGATVDWTNKLKVKSCQLAWLSCMGTPTYFSAIFSRDTFLSRLPQA